MFSFCKKNSEINVPEVTEKSYLHLYESDGIILKSYDYDNIERFLTQKNDTTYVVNFWATWCVPCVEELPHFEKLNQKYSDRKFKMILISLDFPKMVESRVLPFIKEKQLKAEVIHLNDPDANRWIEKVDATWSGAIPATLIYRNDQRNFYESTFDEATLNNEIKKFIN
ncbi:MAG: TlpA disulfide reductase family protein [Flavobacterium sp.]